MASQQRVALFILFDACERDLVARLRTIKLDGEATILNDEERQRAQARHQRRESAVSDVSDDYELLYDLDIGDKFSILMRHKAALDAGARAYYTAQIPTIEMGIPVRNSVMHGRPLTTTEYVNGFAVANELRKAPAYWPLLESAFQNFEQDPQAFLASAVGLLDAERPPETLHNLPEPDYDDTGFLPRPELERELRKKLASRNPIVTVLGDGGNGKTALTLQVLYGMVASNDHPFDAIVWVSAKSSRLGAKEIERIEGAITGSLGLFEKVAEFEPGDDEPIERVRRLLEENAVLLVIDNLETVLDETIKDFAAEVPGESKILFTSRVPLGSDLTVGVGEFTQKEAKTYLYRLIDALGADRLRKLKAAQLDRHITRLGRKPLLLKWFVLGVVSGLEPDRITSNPEVALQFCMENVVDQLQPAAREIAAVMAALPSGVSPVILHHISDMTATVVEAGVAELLRFALVERDQRQGDERVYILKPFVRSYIARVLKRAQEQVNAILARYRGVETAFQIERGTFDQYDTNSFVVRSRSEAVASRRLRHAQALLFKFRYDEAEEIVQQLKITSPEYFEIYRVEAFLAERQGDISRAQACFDTGIELAPEQPQMHYRYALFLGRAYGDYRQAFEQLKEALAIGPKSFVVLKELARNRFFDYDFDAAQTYIDQAKAMDLLTLKEKIIINDLQAQRYCREAEILAQRQEYTAACDSLSKLSRFLYDVEDGLIDTMLVEHLRKIFPLIEQLSRNYLVSDRQAELTELRQFIERYTVGDTPQNDVSVPKVEICTGQLKKEGLKQAFGFLRDVRGRETYVRRDSVSSDLWKDMCDGRTVQFRIAANPWGNTYATSISLL